MMDNDHYAQTKKELIRRKTYPYFFHNKELAKEFYERFKAEVPTASYYEGDEIGQAICYDCKAEKRLYKFIEDRINAHKVAMVRLGEIQIDIQENLGNPLFRKRGKGS